MERLDPTGKHSSHRKTGGKREEEDPSQGIPCPNPGRIQPNHRSPSSPCPRTLGFPPLFPLFRRFFPILRNSHLETSVHRLGFALVCLGLPFPCRLLSLGLWIRSGAPLTGGWNPSGWSSEQHSRKTPQNLKTFLGGSKTSKPPPKNCLNSRRLHRPGPLPGIPPFPPKSGCFSSIYLFFPNSSQICFPQETCLLSFCSKPPKNAFFLPKTKPGSLG